MKLDRNIDGNQGRGKYALLKLRQLAQCDDGETFGGLTPEVKGALEVLERNGVVDWGEEGSESEFFVIRLKDEYAGAALQSYADEARHDDPEYGAEIERRCYTSHSTHYGWCAKGGGA